MVLFQIAGIILFVVCNHIYDLYNPYYLFEIYVYISYIINKLSYYQYIKVLTDWADLQY